jgi:signal transduction histidine kinase
MEAIQDVHEANRCIRELAALSLLPAIWSAGEASQIRDNLADALRSSLRADIVYVRCRDCEGANAAVRATDIPNDEELLRSVTSAVDQSLGGRGLDRIKLAVHGATINLSIFTLGPGQEFGALAVGSRRPDFPTALERILLNVAVNQAIIAFRSAKQLAARREVEHALREAQTELHDHAEKLEEEVAQRTAELRETIQQLEAFSYSVSHDMRSPLRAMQGYSDALLDEYRDKLGSTGVEYLTRIRRSASRMDLLIQDVLAYSRVAKGDIQLTRVNIEAVIRDVVQNYPALQCDRADISVAAPIPPVMGHEAYLTQIVSNLLTNAVKFVERGKKPSVTIRNRAEGEMVRIEFQDNGIGIAAKHQKQIFQIFGRVYSDKLYEGTGIGLAIAKKAAERMGGSLGVESETGVGSNFFVILKRAS